MMLAGMALVAFLLLSTCICVQARPGETEQQAKSAVAITDLLAPLYKQATGKVDVDQITAMQRDLTAIATIINHQELPNAASARQLLLSARSICNLLQSIIDETKQAQDRWNRNEASKGHALGNDREFFMESVQKQWQSRLGQLQTEVAPLWQQLVRFEPALSKPILTEACQASAIAIMQSREEERRKTELKASTLHLTGKVAQVMDDGLLIHCPNADGSSRTFFLRNHPDQGSLVDDDPIDCYALPNKRPYRYVSVTGAQVTVRSCTFATLP